MDSTFIYKYLSNELNEQQTTELLEWINSDEDNRQFFIEIKNYWIGAGLMKAHNNSNDNLNYELFSIRLNEEKNKRKRVLKISSFNNSKNNLVKRFLKIAAVFLLLYSLGTTGYLLFEHNVTEYNQLTTKRGEKSSLVLSDGTKIWLNSETTLKYPSNLNSKNVKLYLDGEAYFEVAKKAGRKFIVNASDINITVLGTSFNVKSYSTEGTMETILEKGSIEITKEGNNAVKDEPVMLKPNQRAVFNKISSQISVTQITQNTDENTQTELKNSTEKPEGIGQIILPTNQEEIKLYTSWKDGSLRFRSERFEELAVRLERWYDVQIIIEDEQLKNSRYTGKFEKENIEQALEALSLSLPFEYTIDQNKITINKIVHPNDK